MEVVDQIGPEKMAFLIRPHISSSSSWYRGFKNVVGWLGQFEPKVELELYSRGNGKKQPSICSDLLLFQFLFFYLFR